MHYLLLILLFSCSKHKVDLNDSKQTIKLDGETKTYVYVEFPFVKEMKSLCTDMYGYEPFENELQRKAFIAECTLDKISILDLDIFRDYKDSFCLDNTQADDVCSEISFLGI